MRNLSILDAPSITAKRVRLSAFVHSASTDTRFVIKANRAGKRLQYDVQRRANARAGRFATRAPRFAFDVTPIVPNVSVSGVA